jgi:uncharacterized protein with von Willebrand factor type A (vWA) domain
MSDQSQTLARIQGGKSGGRLAANIMHFGRILRQAGLPVGPGKIIEAVKAVESIGITNREDFYWTLHAVMVNRRDQREIFDQAFHVFWKNPRILERMMSLLLPEMRVPAGEDDPRQELSRRLTEALYSKSAQEKALEQYEEEVKFDAFMTFSDNEVLQEMDFENMSADEEARAKSLIKRLSLPLAEVPTRRFEPSASGNRIDPRRSFRATLGIGGDMMPLKRKRRRTRTPPLILLCDISGSMSRYSRMLLHFMHAVTNDRDRVQSFVFGTRLTHITRQLRYRDVDEALAKVAEQVEDWSGGTRLGASIGTFNKVWGRRVLGQSPVVLLITDGLDRDAAEGLDHEIERLHKSCSYLMWLNPLLRYDGYQPKSLGAQALIPHVDELRSCHNLNSIEDLVDALQSIDNAPRRSAARIWRDVA